MGYPKTQHEHILELASELLHCAAMSTIGGAYDNEVIVIVRNDNGLNEIGAVVNHCSDMDMLHRQICNIAPTEPEDIDFDVD